ncbi:MAG: PorT family protein [Terrimonas ferruginea]|uniref:porin family protein n=1 Tax=Terrimonas ferruginea TaxID=249 RepID=UPI000AB86FCF|nr:porin family protein [Terrimonas ferruginea]MBN8782804.1 PorT family protein [Terrimonas ferruginea]
MRIFLATVMLSLAAVTASAQTSFGVKAGGNMSFFNYKIEEGSQNVKWNGSRVGFQVGGVAQIGIAENFAIQPELLFMMKGVNKMDVEELGDVKLNIKTFTIDMPITFIYRTNGFFGGIGPNLSFGLSSKMKVDGNDDVEYDLYDKDADGEVSIFSQKRFEAGANILAGYKLKNGLSFSLNFVKGLTNLSEYNDDLEDASIKTKSSYIGLSVGYFFGK